MTYPWASGEVLTAADLNAYSGLILIKTQTIGTAVASVTVSDAFSSTFQNYRITLAGTDCSVGSGNTVQLNFGTTTASNYGSFYYDKFDGTSTGTTRYSGTNTIACGMQSTNTDTSFSMDVFNPHGAARTQFSGLYHGEGWSGWYAGQNTSATSQTSFVISLTSGTMTGGTIRVYGYNNG